MPSWLFQRTILQFRIPRIPDSGTRGTLEVLG